METTTTSSNFGAVASVRGSVVDVRFDGHLPPIYSVLHAGAENKIVIEGLARGMVVTDMGGPLKAPVGKAILSLDVRRVRQRH